MQVTVQKLSPVLVELAVELPKERVGHEIDSVFKEVAKTARLRGFRPGKAPREVIQHVYGGQIERDVAQRLVDGTLNKALSDNGIAPIATVSIAPGKLEPKAAFSYKARFEITPDIAEVKYEGFPVKKPSTKVTDEMINDALEAVRRDHSVLKSPEPARAAKAGDVAVLDLSTDVEGAAVPEFAATDLETEIGSSTLMKAIEEALVGLSVGEKKDVDTTFPDNHPIARVRGKAGVFHITLKDLKERVLPALDDELAKDAGDFADLAALRADVEKKIQQKLDQRAEDAIAEQIVVELCKANPIDVPPSLVAKQAEVTQQEMAQSARRNGQRFQLTAELQNAIRVDAEMKVRAGLVMAAIAKAQQITVTDTDIEKAYEELAVQTGKNVARVKADYRDAQKREMLVGMVLEDKILDVIEAKCAVTEETALAASTATNGGLGALAPGPVVLCAGATARDAGPSAGVPLRGPAFRSPLGPSPPAPLCLTTPRPTGARRAPAGRPSRSDRASRWRGPCRRGCLRCPGT